MRILVTGANGYLGRGIVKRLIEDGCSVIATDFNVDGVDKRADKIPCNLFEVDDPYQFFHEPEIVLHLAWRDGFIHNSRTHIEDLPKHFQFLKKMFESETKRIAVMGSMHEIGFFEGSIKDETPCVPKSLYGIGKDTLRRIIQLMSLQTKIDYQWLRGFYIVSNSINGNSIFSKISSAAETGETEFPFTTGQNQYDFLDYEDFCAQVATTVEQNEICEVINICSGKPEKLANRVERYIQENHFAIKLKYGVYPDRAYDSQAVWGDATKIKKIMRK